MDGENLMLEMETNKHSDGQKSYEIKNFRDERDAALVSYQKQV